MVLLAEPAFMASIAALRAIVPDLKEAVKSPLKTSRRIFVAVVNIVEPWLSVKGEVVVAK
jgi:hypothetical protein